MRFHFQLQSLFLVQRSKYCRRNVYLLFVLTADVHSNQSKSLNKLLFNYAVAIAFHFHILYCANVLLSIQIVFNEITRAIVYTDTHHSIPCHAMPRHVISLQEVVIFFWNDNNPSFQCVKLALLSDVVQFAHFILQIHAILLHGKNLIL